MVKLSSFHIARIGTSVLSSSASFIIITFCKLDGAFVLALLEGGPMGGKDEVDMVMDAEAGLVTTEDSDPCEV